ncbi:MAG: 50S ribosomal protein L17 [Sedimentisphaerales bacterium]
MRHRVAGRRLSRTSQHRLAMRRNLVAQLFQHETISTTIEKAKEVKAFAEKLITLSKKGTLSARRRAIALLGDRDIIDHEDGKPVKKGTLIGKLFSEIGPRYLDRPGGYTRIIRLSLRRLGDNGQVVLLQLVGPEETSKKETKAASKKRSRKRAKKTVEVEEDVQTQETTETEETTVAEEADEVEGTTENSGRQKEPGQ